MSARYWVLCSDELMQAQQPMWPPGFSPLHSRNDATSTGQPGFSWWLFDDADAPDELAGRKVELTIKANIGDDGVWASEVADRRVIG